MTQNVYTQRRTPDEAKNVAIRGYSHDGAANKIGHHGRYRLKTTWIQTAQQSPQPQWRGYSHEQPHFFVDFGFTQSGVIFSLPYDTCGRS